MKQKHIAIYLFLSLINLFFFIKSFAQNIPELKVNTTHAESVNAVAFSSNGQFALSGSNDKTMKLWEPVSGREIRTFTGHTQGVTSVGFVPGGKQLVSGSWDKTLRLWDMATGKEIKTIDYGNAIMSVHVSPDGKRVAAGGSSGLILIWDLATAKEIMRLEGHTGVVNKILFHPDKKHLLSAGTDNELKLWDISLGKPVRTYKGHTNQVTVFDISPDGKLMLSGGMDNTVILWDIFSGKQLKVFNKFGNNIASVKFSPDGKTFFTSAKFEAIKLWDVATGYELSAEPYVGFYVQDAAFAPDGKTILTGDIYRNVKIRAVPSLRELICLGGQQGKLQAVKINTDNVFFSMDSILYRISLKGNRKLHSYALHKAAILDISLSANGLYLLTASKDKTIKLWDIKNEKVIHTFSGHDAPITLVRFSPDGKQFVSAGFDKKILLWHVDSVKEIRSFFKPENITPDNPMNTKGTIHDVQFSSDGKYLVSASMESSKKYVNIWEIATGKNTGTFKGHEFMTRAACFVPGNKKVISGGNDKKLILWDINTSKEEKVFAGHSGYINAITVSPDGKSVISASEDNTMILWNLFSGDSIHVFKGHQGAVESVQFFNSGKIIISESKDNTIKVWNNATGTELCTFFNMGPTDWTVVTPDGKFDGTERAVKDIYFVKGTDILPLDAYFEKNYTPGLMAMVLNGFLAENIKNNLSGINTPPTVIIKTMLKDSVVTSEQVTLEIEVTDKGGGIDEIRLYHNGKLVEWSQRGFKEWTQKGNTVTQKFTVPVLFGPNEFVATAFTKDRTEGVSQPVNIIYNMTFHKPSLHILALGIDTYKNSKYTLNYAVADAQALVDILSANTNNLFDTVEVVFIKDTMAIRDNIIHAFTVMTERVQPNDVFVFYYAGHGVVSEPLKNETPEFFLIPYDVTQMYAERNALKNKAISASELNKWLINIKARKQLVVLDACQSGAATDALSLRGMAEEKAIAQLARSAGIVVLAASSSNQYAEEIKELGHGAFTYALLEGLKGKADSGVKDFKITVFELKAWLDDRVPELTSKYRNSAQYPSSFSKGQDFPLKVIH